jgi:hypothetical protein
LPQKTGLSAPIFFAGNGKKVFPLQSLAPKGGFALRAPGPLNESNRPCPGLFGGLFNRADAFEMEAQLFILDLDMVYQPVVDFLLHLTGEFLAGPFQYQTVGEILDHLFKAVVELLVVWKIGVLVFLLNLFFVKKMLDGITVKKVHAFFELIP